MSCPTWWWWRRRRQRQRQRGHPNLLCCISTASWYGHRAQTVAGFSVRVIGAQLWCNTRRSAVHGPEPIQHIIVRVQYGIDFVRHMFGYATQHTRREFDSGRMRTDYEWRSERWLRCGVRCVRTCVSDRLSAWARALRSAPTTYWLLSNACSSFSSCDGENAVRTRFGLRNGCSRKSVGIRMIDVRIRWLWKVIASVFLCVNYYGGVYWKCSDRSILHIVYLTRR